MPAANTEAMNAHLAEISTQVAAGAHAVLIVDGAGWHQEGGRLIVPENISLLPLPRYSPELNPMENVWEYLRANKLCNRVWNSYDAIIRACKTRGTFWSTTHNVFAPSAHGTGHVSAFRRIGIRRP